jgi:hypothetical protein
VIHSKIVVLPITAFRRKATADPRDAPFINLRNTKGTTTSQKLLVNPHRVAMDEVTVVKEFRRYSHEPDSVADA